MSELARFANADLIVARHGETAANAARRYQGSLNEDLTETGVAQARELSNQLQTRIAAIRHASSASSVPRGRNEIVCFTSDRLRAMHTARIALPGVPPVVSAALRELDFGDIEGLTHDQALSMHGAAYTRWVASPETERAPGGESLDELRARVRAWLTVLPADALIIAIAHAGWIRALLCELFELPWSQAARISIPCGQFLHVISDGSVQSDGAFDSNDVVRPAGEVAV